MAQAATSTKPKKRKGAFLREDVSYLPKGSPLKVVKEGENYFIENVRVCGFESRNGRKYVPEGVDEKLYEGLNVNIDHPDPDKKTPRAFNDRFGWLVGSSKKTDGIYAKKLYFNPKHPLAESFKWWAENAPHRIGLSPNQYGDVSEGSGGQIVHKVTDVKSVDLVADPATTKGLFECMQWDAPTKTRKLQEMFDEDEKEEAEPPFGGDSGGGGGGAPTMEEDEPAVDEGDETPGMSMDSGPAGEGDGDIGPELCAAASKIFNAKDMDVKDKIKKIKALLGMYHDVGEAMKTKPGNLAEAKKLLATTKLPAGMMVLEALDTMEVAENIRKKEQKRDALIKAANLPEAAVTDFWKEQLLECRDEAHMLRAIEDRRTLVGTNKQRKPQSSGQRHIPESEHDSHELPKSKEEYEKSLQKFEEGIFGVRD